MNQYKRGDIVRIIQADPILPDLIPARLITAEYKEVNGIPLLWSYLIHIRCENKDEYRPIDREWAEPVTDKKLRFQYLMGGPFIDE